MVAKSIGVGINSSDNVLLSWTGSVWTKRNDTSSFLSDWSNGYSTIHNYAIKGACIECFSWNPIVNLWFNNELTAIDFSTAQASCNGKNMRLPTLAETTASIIGGIIAGATNWAWTSNIVNPSYHTVWFGATSTGGPNTNGYSVRCVR